MPDHHHPIQMENKAPDLGLPKSRGLEGSFRRSAVGFPMISLVLVFRSWVSGKCVHGLLQYLCSLVVGGKSNWKKKDPQHATYSCRKNVTLSVLCCGRTLTVRVGIRPLLSPMAEGQGLAANI